MDITLHIHVQCYYCVCLCVSNKVTARNEDEVNEQILPVSLYVYNIERGAHHVTFPCTYLCDRGQPYRLVNTFIGQLA